MCKTTVVNKRTNEYDIYIGRGSIWGNPFHIGKDGSRNQVITKYAEYIAKRLDLLERIPNLKGKRLGCFCKPQACHGDILAKLADQ